MITKQIFPSDSGFNPYIGQVVDFHHIFPSLFHLILQSELIITCSND